MQGVGFEDETILDNISREMFSKVFRAETNWESSEGCCIISFDKEARNDELNLNLLSSVLLQKKSKKSFALNGALLMDCDFWVNLATVLKRNLGLCLFYCLLGRRNMLF